MNAQAGPRVICSDCKHVTTERSEGQFCDRKIETKTSYHECGGVYNITKGELFKLEHGISRTLKRNMLRNGLNMSQIREYRELRKRRKKLQTTNRKAKHDAALGHRRNKASGTNKKK